MSDNHILQDDCGGDNRTSSRSDDPPDAIPERPGPEETEGPAGLPDAATISRTTGDTSAPVARSSSELDPAREESEGNPDGASAPGPPTDTEGPRSGSAAARDEGARATSLPAPDPRMIRQGGGDPAEVDATLQQLATEINQGHRDYKLTTLDGLKHAGYVGERLVHAKRLCPPRQFQRWRRQHCPNLKPRTARYYTWVYLNPELALERSERKRQSVAARKRPAHTAAAAPQTPTGQVAERHRGGAKCSPPTADECPNDDATGDLPVDDQTDGHAEGEIDPRAKESAGSDRSRSPGNPAPALPDSSRQEADGETPLERNGPGQADDVGNEDRDDPIPKPTNAARFVHLCWDITDTANDAIRELGAGTDAQVVERLRLLVPQAMKSLGEVALALQIE